MPCEHLQVHPSLSADVASARAAVVRAVEAFRQGACDWTFVEAALDESDRALRTAWRLELERRNRN